MAIKCNRYLEKDAVLDVLAEYTDFNNGTDVSGHIPFVLYQIGRNFNVKVLYAMGERGIGSGNDIQTFKIDVSASF